MELHRLRASQVSVAQPLIVYAFQMDIFLEMLIL